MAAEYLPPDASPTREEIDGAKGLLLLEFGTDWCGICEAAAPRIAEQLARHPEVRHVKVEDGPGRKLGRSFRVKLWPSLIFLDDGKPIRQLARPDQRALEEAFAALVSRRAP